MQGLTDIIKLSFRAYMEVSDTYQLLTAGSALGSGVGPLIISKKSFDHPESEIKSVAIPGKYTTANLLFSVFYPRITNKEEMVFSSIEDAVLADHTDAGVIIHENRFTYQARGLKKIADLGALWEIRTGQPIPLGGIAIRRALPDNVKNDINRFVHASVAFALSHPEASAEYVKSNAQEMDPEVRKKHIELYVNEFSLDLGPSGKKAIRQLFEMAVNSGTSATIHEPVFVDEYP